MNCYYNPVHTLQGPGCLAQLPALLHTLPAEEHRVLVLAWSEEALRHPVLAGLLTPGGEFAAQSLVFTASNPTVEQLFDAWRATRDFAPRVVVGVGGGTILDVAKSLCCLYGRDLQDVDDLRAQIAAGNLVPTAEIIQAFPDEDLNSDKLHTNGDFFEAVSFSGSHQAGLQAVIKGDVDVVPISDQILASEIANGNAAEDDVKIIHESAAIPAEAVVVAEQVDQATRDKLVEFLTSYDNEQYFTDVIKVPGARFVECDMSDYEDIIELNKIINEF